MPKVVGIKLTDTDFEAWTAAAGDMPLVKFIRECVEFRLAAPILHEGSTTITTKQVVTVKKVNPVNSVVIAQPGQTRVERIQALGYDCARISVNNDLVDSNGNKTGFALLRPEVKDIITGRG